MNKTEKEEFAKSSILPLWIVDDFGNRIEITICDSISGGANEIDNMPRNLTLKRKKIINGVWHTFYALYQIKEY
jgi:hypothetical protein